MKQPATPGVQVIINSVVYASGDLTQYFLMKILAYHDNILMSMTLYMIDK